MKRRWVYLILAAAYFTGGGGVTGGCQRQLFNNSDPYTQSRLRYCNNDSAEQTTAQRKRASEMGFGWPTGAGIQ